MLNTVQLNGESSEAFSEEGLRSLVRLLVVNLHSITAEYFIARMHAHTHTLHSPKALLLLLQAQQNPWLVVCTGLQVSLLYC